MYNDCFGHLAGDRALRLIERTIQAHLREAIAFIATAVKSFWSFSPETIAGDDAKAAMDRVRQAVERLGIEQAPTAPSVAVTLSAGIATLGEGSVSDWLFRADAALYQAKRLGRNRVETEDPAVAPASRFDPRALSRVAAGGKVLARIFPGYVFCQLLHRMVALANGPPHQIKCPSK